MTGRIPTSPPVDPQQSAPVASVLDGSPFFLVGELPPTGPYLLDGPEGRHAATVRRLRAGERLVLTDGAGGWAPAVVARPDRTELRLDVLSVHRTAPPQLRVVLVQAIPKGEHGELAVDLATEAGVDEIVPWLASRCVTRWPGERADKGMARWRSTAREAAKQARRTRVPQIRPPACTAAVATLIARAAAALVLHESEAAPLAAMRFPDSGDLVLVVGPEGGISPEELSEFAAAGARRARLGPEVLRSSAAAAVALGALGVLTDRWGSSLTAGGAGRPPGVSAGKPVHE